MSAPAKVYDGARCDAPSTQDILKRDGEKVPEILRYAEFEYLGSKDIPREQYISREFHNLEMARMWSKVWQMACRADDIPEVGDHLIYEIGDYSILIVRSTPEKIQAFHNVCLHRGRILRECGGHAKQFRCPFHAFSWNLDGTLRDVPCKWDFPHVEEKEFSLPEVQVGRWGGFVFINLDKDAMPLENYLEVIPEHFKRWQYEDRYKAAFVGKVVPANWKVCMEAFLESFHVIATHPQIMPSTADANSQYDIFAGKPHVNRMITPMGVPSPHLGENYPEEKIFEQMIKEYSGPGGAKLNAKLPSGQTTRRYLGQMLRNIVSMSTGRDLSNATDGEMLDAIQYFVFPNFVPWGGFFQNIVYRFRPNGNDPHSCLMEVMLLALAPKGKKPADAKYHFLKDGEPWTEAKELGLLGAVFEQDMSNLPYVQKGLKAMHKPGITLGNYQESRIRHFHHTLDRYLYGQNGGTQK